MLRYLGVNSGDLQKGVLRLEPNVSVRPRGSPILGTRVEIKNLNSFRALERGVSYEIERQINLLEQGKTVIQETVGWDASQEITVTQRVKEGEDDYRYFPEPDLPPVVIESEWIERIRASLPELPAAKYDRFRSQFGLNDYDASVLTAEPSIADYFEQVVKAASSEEAERINPKMLANWVSVELFSLLNQAGLSNRGNAYITSGAGWPGRPGSARRDQSKYSQERYDRDVCHGEISTDHCRRTRLETNLRFHIHRRTGTASTGRKPGTGSRISCR